MSFCKANAYSSALPLQSRYMSTQHHIPFMQRCLQLAMLGGGMVATNPLVGAVLVHNGRILGEGWHQIFGGPHAEVNCFEAVKDADKQLIKESTLYVSLEPCAHYGKTPPCSLRIISEGIKKVVIGMKDPFVHVNGMGITHLRDAGIEVLTGVLEKECQALNRRFVTFHKKKRPYVHLKWAQTADGFIAAEGGLLRLKITNAITAREVHKWRFEEGGILVGTQTALKDNPLLDTRYWIRSPIKKIVIDRNLLLPLSLQLFQDGSEVILLNEVKEGYDNNIRYLKTDFSHQNKVDGILKALHTLNIQSILVEGGAETLRYFLASGIWDEAHILSNTFLCAGQGLKSPEMKDGQLIETKWIAGDCIKHYLHI
jgi:diaminohydroxyphosphoribosylaminopyrimidine deaminase / 5-amino-6-(5-phosphoribosylamino)uracil reductase